MPLRSMPRVGGGVVVNFLGATRNGTVRAVSPDGRRLEVLTEEGETLVFALNRATATFTLMGHQTGARLAFTD
jgi:phage gp45-like